MYMSIYLFHTTVCSIQWCVCCGGKPLLPLHLDHLYDMRCLTLLEENTTTLWMFSQSANYVEGCKMSECPLTKASFELKLCTFTC